MTVRQILVQLYASPTWEQIDDTPQFLLDAFHENSYSAVLALPGFKEERERVAAARRRVAQITERYADPVDQALQCLVELRSRRKKSEHHVSRSPDYEVARDLIASTIGVSWAPPIREEYDRRRSFIEGWDDVFISYTNRGLPATNNLYRGLIKTVLGWPGTADVNARNLLARLLAKYFEQFDVHCFVDYQRLQCGDELQEAISQHCKSAIAFVQLVEPATFVRPDAASQNWCYFEYQTFISADPPPRAVSAGQMNRIYFTITVEIAGEEAEDVPEVYSAWFERATTKDLHFVIERLNAQTGELREGVRRIARQIRDSRERLMDAVLASWEQRP